MSMTQKEMMAMTKEQLIKILLNQQEENEELQKENEELKEEVNGRVVIEDIAELFGSDEGENFDWEDEIGAIIFENKKLKKENKKLEEESESFEENLEEIQSILDLDDGCGGMMFHFDRYDQCVKKVKEIVEENKKLKEENKKVEDEINKIVEYHNKGDGMKMFCDKNGGGGVFQNTIAGIGEALKTMKFQAFNM